MRTDFSSLYLTQQNTKRATTNSMRREAFNRWEYSIRVWNSIGGINWPWQSGQSGHPNPDSLDLTYPPNVTWLNAEISVTIDSHLRLLLEVDSGGDFLSNKVGYLFRSVARLTIFTLCAFFHLLTVAYRFWVVKTPIKMIIIEIRFWFGIAGF